VERILLPAPTTPGAAVASEGRREVNGLTFARRGSWAPAAQWLHRAEGGLSRPGGSLRTE
jgi:hypothetical protein